ncbi:MAG: hypothetical protein ACK56F_09225 [bacterium]
MESRDSSKFWGDDGYGTKLFDLNLRVGDLRDFMPLTELNNCDFTRWKGTWSTSSTMISAFDLFSSFLLWIAAYCSPGSLNRDAV